MSLQPSSPPPSTTQEKSADGYCLFSSSLNTIHPAFLLPHSINPTGGDAISRAIRMTPGDSTTSYAANSDRQAFVFRTFRPLLVELIRSLAIEAHAQTITVVDLGSATGMNTISEIQFVLETVYDGITDTHRMPEFQVFFNDLPSNDFNHPFSLLQQHPLKNQRPSIVTKAVPASFYQLLCPRQSIQVAFSTMAFHWLSALPPTSAAFNRGRLWIDGGDEAAGKAYAEQSQKDLKNFFSCRATELCRGGVLWLCMMGRSDSSPPTAQTDPNEGAQCGPDFEAAWKDIVKEGLVDQET